MPLTPEQELREHELRVEQISLNIERIRADVKAEQRKITLQTLGAVVAAFAAGVAFLALLNNYFHH